MVIELDVNDARTVVDVDPSTPLLWVLRDNLQLMGIDGGVDPRDSGGLGWF